MRPYIIERLYEFSGTWKKRNNKKRMLELFFCLLTPQSKARLCWAAVMKLKEHDLLINGGVKNISACMDGVRFKNNKALYIYHARDQFARIDKAVRTHSDIFRLRDWLVKNVKGLGMKESSHFLRNIGLGDNISILDRHVLKNLVLLGVIDRIPQNISRRKYIEIEDRMRRFSKNIKIPLVQLDLLLWAKETGEIFK